ncbi:integrase, catalytic region, zinc finger, CCHC-type containing protein [Tanacetum coccineum]
MHNNIMAAGLRDRLRMLATGRYDQWQSRFLRYIEIRPNGDTLRKCILEGPYQPTTVTIQAVPAIADSPAVPERTVVETIMTMTPENKAHYESEKEAVHLLLTGIRDEIYSTVDACKTAHEMWIAIERLQQGKEIAKPITPPSESAFEEDSDPEQAQRDKDMQKNWHSLQSTSKRSTNLPTTTSKLLQTLEKRMWILIQGSQEEIVERELEAHYSFMEEIQEVPTADSGTDTEPLEQVQNNAEHNVFANVRHHSEQSESTSNTCLVEKDDSNAEDERAALANLIANLKLDVDENKKIQKQLKKANASLAHELKECKYILVETSKTLGESNIDYDKLERKLNETLGLLAQKDIDIKEGLKLKAYEISVVKEKHDELVKQSLLTKSHFEGLVKEKTKVITDLKLKEEKDIDKMISMEKQLKFLNEIVYKRNQSIQTIHMLAPKGPTFNGRPTFANPMYLKKAQYEKPCLYEIPYDQSDPANRLVPDREETLTLEKESRSKLNKDLVRPYDYTKLNSLYEIFKPASQEYNEQLAHANEVESNVTTNNINHFRELVNQAWEKHSHNQFHALTALDMEVLIKTCLMPLAIKTQNNSFTFDHELKQEMHADLRNKIWMSQSTLMGKSNACGNFVGQILYQSFGNDQFSPIPGYGDLFIASDAMLEVAFWKSTCFIRDLQENDLLTGNRGSDLYTISLHEITSSTLICLMDKASPTQAWLWHRRLTHLNFDYINLLLKKDVVIGLPKLKYVKDQLCSSCEVSKEKRSSFKTKAVPCSKGRLNLFHMDLCGPMRVASMNGKKYILVIVDDYSRYTWTLFLRSKDETP